MTLKQVEKLRISIQELNSLRDNPTPKAISKVDSSLENFFHEMYKSPYLNISNHYMYGTSIDKEQMLSDIDDIISVLNGMIALDSKTAQISDVLELICEGENIDESYEARQKFISKVFYSYGDDVKFDKSIISVANRSIKTDVNLDWGFTEENSIDDTVIEGIIRKLRVYAQEVLDGKKNSNSKTKSPAVVINNNPTMSANATANVSVDISAVFENARQKIEDEGLSDVQTKELLDKLSELEEISKSKESKGKRWTKAKEIMKWLVEQGIAAAGILIPVLSEVIK